MRAIVCVAVEPGKHDQFKPPRVMLLLLLTWFSLGCSSPPSSTSSVLDKAPTSTTPPSGAGSHGTPEPPRPTVAPHLPSPPPQHPSNNQPSLEVQKAVGWIEANLKQADRKVTDFERRVEARKWIEAHRLSADLSPHFLPLNGLATEFARPEVDELIKRFFAVREKRRAADIQAMHALVRVMEGQAVGRIPIGESTEAQFAKQVNMPVEFALDLFRRYQAQDPSAIQDLLDRAHRAKDLEEELVDIKELARSYRANEARADRLYKGKRHVMSANLLQVRKSLGQVSLMLEAGGFGLLGAVRCVLANSADPKVAEIDEGDLVSIRGEVNGKLLSSIEVSACEIIAL